MPAQSSWWRTDGGGQQKNARMRRRRALHAGRRRPVSQTLLLRKSGTGVEGQPDAERLLPRRALGPLQLFGYFRRGGFLFRQRLQFTNFGRRPSAPLL